MTDKRSFQLVVFSWVVEFMYMLTEVLRGEFSLGQHMPGLVACVAMFVWSTMVYRKLETERERELGIPLRIRNGPPAGG